MREYCTVGLVFVDGAQILAQHPHSGVEPLEGGEQVHEEHVPRMTQADVSPFMGENGGIACLIVATIHHNIAHPTERSHVSVTGHADDGAIRFRMLFALSYQEQDFPYRQQGVPQRRQHTYYI